MFSTALSLIITLVMGDACQLGWSEVHDKMARIGNKFVAEFDGAAATSVLGYTSTFLDKPGKMLKGEHVVMYHDQEYDLMVIMAGSPVCVEEWTLLPARLFVSQSEPI